MSSEMKCNCFDTAYWKANRFGRCPRCDYVEPPPVPRSSLPALPDNLKPPFIATGSVVGDRYSMILTAIDPTEAAFLAALLNAVYGGGEGKS